MSVNLLTDFQGNQLPLANENLLINSDFRNPINQRRQSSYSTSSERVFTVDRFYISGSASLNVNDGYLAVTLNNASSELGQSVEIPLTLINHLTLSMKLLNFANPYVASIENVNTMAASESKTASIGANGIFRVYRNVNAQGDYFTAQLRATSATTFNIEWLKLEIGLIATPLIPKLIAEELLLCQRYGYDVLNGSSTYGYVGDGIRIPGNLGRIWIDIPIAMRTIPTLEANGTFQLFNGTSTEVNITSFYLTNLFCSSNKISINIPNLSSYEEGDYLTMRVSNNASASFFLDAEIY
nr:MAG TPA: tail fiber protein [Caudoviricetes sp.]